MLRRKLRSVILSPRVTLSLRDGVDSFSEDEILARDRLQRGATGKGDLTPEIIRLGLRKILANEVFARSSRQSRFLRFTVEETLAGRGPDLKQYVIGLKVFDRADSFDPQSDPIVRIGAMRVRAKLKAYYETEGREDSIVIEFPHGYMPVFRCRQKTPQKPKSLWFRLRRAIDAVKQASWLRFALLPCKLSF